MGWFDDSDSEEESSKKRRRDELFNLDDLTPTPAAPAPTPTVEASANPDPDHNTNANGNEPDPLDAYMSGIHKEAQSAVAAVAVAVSAVPDPVDGKDHEQDEVDPLDAYMTSLASSSSTPAATTNVGRLDMENEEEATSHWVEASTSASLSKKRLLPSRQEEHGTDGDRKASSSSSSSLTSMQAKSFMANTFHKAGSGKQKKRDLGQVIDSEDDDAVMAAEANAARRSRTITPLDKIQHSTVTYQPFVKQFYNHPANTRVGMEWRKENHISTSMDVDPIDSFERYGELGLLDKVILDYLNKQQFEKATLVQAQSIPIAMTGRDLLVTSHTGRYAISSHYLPMWHYA
jgi:hypothetical protein